MFASALVVFREVLEAALIVGIVAAATQGVPGRARWLVAGLLAGLGGSALVAAVTDVIAEMASGIGQELFNALVLVIAVVMLAWHNIWMSVHGRELASDAKRIGTAIQDGRRECSIIFVIVAVAVLREGSETVLFLYGVATAGAQPLHTTLFGGLIGLAGGVIVGGALYAGLLRIPLRWFFSVISVLVLLLAAGMASQAASFLIQADLLPSLGAPIWDTSAALPQGSALGILLHGLVGYDARPAGMQIVCYVLVLVACVAGTKMANRLAFGQPDKEAMP